MDPGAKLQAPPSATEMDDMDDMSTVWPDKPVKCRIHVCLRPPGEPLIFCLTRTLHPASLARLKRAAPESSNIHAQFKRKRLAKDAPSSLATSKNYHSL